MCGPETKSGAFGAAVRRICRSESQSLIIWRRPGTPAVAASHRLHGDADRLLSEHRTTEYRRGSRRCHPPPSNFSVQACWERRSAAYGRPGGSAMADVHSPHPEPARAENGSRPYDPPAQRSASGSEQRPHILTPEQARRVWLAIENWRPDCGATGRCNRPSGPRSPHC
jgi:hypothetical protein